MAEQERPGLAVLDDSLIRRLSQKDIAGAVSRRTYEKGARYWQARRVLSLRWEPAMGDGVTVVASVRGSASRPYALRAFVDPCPDGSLSIDGECSCPVGYNCKHLAAALFAVIAEAPRRLRPPATTGQAALSPALALWIDDLARLDESESEAYPPTVRQRLLYVLDLRRNALGSQRLVVTPVSARLLKDETFSPGAQPYNPANVLQGVPAKFLRPSDRTILRRLEYLSRQAGFGGAYQERALSGEEGVAILEAMIATGRARWQAAGGAVVRRGDPRRAQLVWRLADDAAQHVDVDVEGEGPVRPVCLAPPWYVDEAAGVLGPLETGLGARVAEAFLSAPPVPAGQSAALGAAVEARIPGLAALKPPAPAPPEQAGGPPVPRLRLTARERPRPRYYDGQGMPEERMPVARLSFLYGGAEVADRDQRPRPAVVREGRVVEVTRDLRAELERKRQIQALGFVPLAEQMPYGLPLDGDDDLTLGGRQEDAAWLDLLYRDVPALRATGWDVAVDPSFPFALVRVDDGIEAQVREGSGIDWFELDLGIAVDGERVDLTAALLSIITDPRFDPARLDAPPAETDIVYVPLDGVRTLAIPAVRVWRILAALHELFSSGRLGSRDTAIAISPFDAAELARLEAETAPAGVVWTGGEQVRQLGALLRASGGIPHIDIPSSFTATLRPYQASGVDWLQLLQAAGLGAVLADDMGLGKTVETLAHLAVEQASGRMDRPALIVAPTSLVANWRQEAARFAPALKVLVLHGPGRQERFGEIGAHDLVITTYPLLARDHAALAAQEWHLVVLDEAQAIKNPDAAVSRLARDLRARQRLCLTGTPVENHLGELWSLFAFLAPGFLGDRKQFNRHWRRPIEVEGDDGRRQQLARRVRPFLLRRTKAGVAAELPAKTEIVERVEMEAAQRDVYESVRLAVHERVRDAIARQGLARSQIVILDALLKLRQACCDPRLLKLETARAIRARSAKFDRLMEMLPELVEDGRRVLLFSQFTSMLALIEEALKEAAIPYVLLTGDTRDRETPVRTFQCGDVPLFLISLKAGGVGLNLTAADTVVHYDPWWNPAAEDQATDRAHRIGQERPVFVYRLVTLDSIEEKMEVLKARKRELAAGIFDPEAGSPLDLREADIEALFAPT